MLPASHNIDDGVKGRKKAQRHSLGLRKKTFEKIRASIQQPAEFDVFFKQSLRLQAQQAWWQRWRQLQSQTQSRIEKP